MSDHSPLVSLPGITVVILNWNGRDWLSKFLPGVMASSYPNLEVMVVDNGSTDDSLSWVSQHEPAAKVLSLGKNHGFAQGNNLALSHIDTPYFVLLNSDVEVTPGWLEPLVAEMEREGPQLAAAQPKVLAWHRREAFEYAGACGGWIDRFGYAFCRGRIFDHLELDHGQYDAAEDCLWATGACLMVRTEVVKQVGLFHEEFFAHWEEIDFCWRLWNLGYRVRGVPSSVVYHVGGGTLPQGNPRKTFLNVRNSLVCLFLNLPTQSRFGVLLGRLLLDGVWGVRALLQRDLVTFSAILKGHWAFFGKLLFWQKKRLSVYGDRLPRSIPRSGVWRGSIVWAYFVQGKKKFSDLVHP